MTNDTNTLNGALMELGELMASNLNTMGVDDATSQDGLTTLANKILNIQSINIMSFSVYGDINIQDFNPVYNGDNLVILWGDQSYSRYIDGALQYTYDDDRHEHIVYIIGDITELGDNCFNACTNMNSISIPDSVIRLGSACFNECYNLIDINIPNSIVSFGDSCFASCGNLAEIIIPDGVTEIGNYCFSNCLLESISIPSSVISIGDYCFDGCFLENYELYWTGSNIIQYDSHKMPVIENNINTIFTIPFDEKQNYIDKGYPANSIRERSIHNYILSVSCNTPVIESGNTATIVATLTDNGVAVAGESVVFKNGSTVLDTVTTDNNGQASYTYTGTGAGDITFTVESMSLQETFVVEDVYKYVTDFTSWTGTTPIYSDFEIPLNHEIIIKPLAIPNFQVACSDLNDNWIYAQNIGFNNNSEFNYRNNTTNFTIRTSLTASANSIYRITCENLTVKIYQDDVLVLTQTTVNRGSDKHIRIFNNADNIEYIKFKAL